MATHALPTKATYYAFMEELGRAAERVLILNHDVVAELFSKPRTDPTRATVNALLDCMVSSGHTHVVLVTSRELRELEALRIQQPRPEIWGCNGLERLLPDGTYELRELDQDSLAALIEADAWLEQVNLQHVVELKAGGLVLHWDRCSDPNLQKQLRAKALRALSPLAQKTRLLLVDSEDNLELRIAKNRKADVIRTIISELPHNSAIAYVGSSSTDEDAFHALHGHGLSILLTSSYRPSDADLFLEPDEILKFLKAWLRACGGEA